MFGHYVIVREENGKWEYALAGGNESIVDVRDILFFNTQD
jgi:uncharacterized protein YegP (UPF0339 family)